MFIMSACSFSNLKETEQGLQVASSDLVTDFTTEMTYEMVTAEMHEEENHSEGIIIEAEMILDDFESIKSAMINFITNSIEKGAIKGISV